MDNGETIALLTSLDNVDDNGSYGAAASGSALLTILDGVENPQQSNFGRTSFQLTNTGDKQIAAVVIDFRTAVFGDSVIDNDGSGGDSAAKPFGINSNGGTGGFFDQSEAYLFPGASPLENDTGTGLRSSGGFEGVLIQFDGRGFTNGETVGFSGDMDPNSIAGLEKNGGSGVDTGAIEGWDVGGISGSELIGSSFTVLFDDGTTATGYLHSDNSQSGSIGEAVEDAAPRTVAIAVDNGAEDVSSGEAGLYGDTAPVVTVTGTAGDTVRVVLQKGFNPVTNDTNGIADLVADRLAEAHPDFLANNAFDLQTYDVVIPQNGVATLPADAFDFVNTASGVSFDGDDTSPLAFSAAVIGAATAGHNNVLNGDSNVALGPVSAPVYLSYSDDVVALPREPDVEAGQDVLANGTFDVTNTFANYANVAVEGWQSNNGRLEVWRDGFLGFDAADGSHLIELDTNGRRLDTVFQDVETTEGAEYTLSFSAAQRGNDADSIQVFWAGELIDTVTPDDRSNFVEFTYTVQGTGGTDRLQFRELASQNDGSGPLLDAVQLLTTEDTTPPEPVLSDTFGIELFDADSDELISALYDGADISHSSALDQLTIKADYIGDGVGGDDDGSIQFEFFDENGNLLVDHTENALPFVLFGDNSVENFRSGGISFEDGDYTLQLTAYSANRGAGEVLAVETIGFTLASDGIEFL